MAKQLGYACINLELHKQGKKEVLIPNATGSVQVMRYPLFEIRRIKSFHNGQMTFRIETGEADLKGWKRAILANATHMTDGAILAIALSAAHNRGNARGGAIT